MPSSSPPGIFPSRASSLLQPANIKTANVDNRKLLAKIPDFAFTLNPNKQSGVYTRSISDANYSALYFRDKGFNKKVDKEVFRETYVKQIRNAFLDEINNPSYMTGLALNEIITYNKASTGFAAGS